MKFKIADVIYSPIHEKYGFVTEVKNSTPNEYGGVPKTILICWFNNSNISEFFVGSIVYQTFEKLNET